MLLEFSRSHPPTHEPSPFQESGVSHCPLAPSPALPTHCFPCFLHGKQSLCWLPWAVLNSLSKEILEPPAAFPVAPAPCFCCPTAAARGRMSSVLPGVFETSGCQEPCCGSPRWLGQRRGDESWRRGNGFRMEGFGVLFFALGKSPLCSRAKCCRAKAQLSSLHPSKGTGKMGLCQGGISPVIPLEAALGALWLWMSFWRFWMSWGIFPCIGAGPGACVQVPGWHRAVGVGSTPLGQEPAGDGGWRVGMPSSWGWGDVGTAWLSPQPRMWRAGSQAWEAAGGMAGAGLEQPRNSPSVTPGPGCVLRCARQSQTQRGGALGSPGS